jgi:hypothetical protein
VLAAVRSFRAGGISGDADVCICCRLRTSGVRRGEPGRVWKVEMMRTRTLGILAAALCVGVVVASAAAAPPAGINRDPTGAAIFAHWFYPTNAGKRFTVDHDGNMSPTGTDPISRSKPILMVRSREIGRPAGAGHPERLSCYRLSLA